MTGTQVRNVHWVLQKALNYAVRLGYIARNPTEAADKPREDTEERPVYTPEQIRRFMVAWKEIDPRPCGIWCSRPGWGGRNRPPWIGIRRPLLFVRLARRLDLTSPSTISRADRVDRCSVSMPVPPMFYPPGRVHPRRGAGGEVANEPGGLPLLSTALVQLWQAGDGEWLRFDAYQRGGGVRYLQFRRSPHDNFNNPYQGEPVPICTSGAGDVHLLFRVGFVPHDVKTEAASGAGSLEGQREVCRIAPSGRMPCVEVGAVQGEDGVAGDRLRVELS